MLGHFQQFSQSGKPSPLPFMIPADEHFFLVAMHQAFRWSALLVRQFADPDRRREFSRLLRLYKDEVRELRDMREHHGNLTKGYADRSKRSFHAVIGDARSSIAFGRLVVQTPDGEIEEPGGYRIGLTLSVTDVMATAQQLVEMILELINQQPKVML